MFNYLIDQVMLEYVEPSFEIVYLALGLLASIYVIIKSRKRPAHLILASMGLSMVFCDAMSYIPKMIGPWCFQISDIYRYFGIGRTGISVSMTVIYTLIYVLYRIIYKNRIPPITDWIVSALVVIRIALFLVPTDGWQINQNFHLLSFLEKIPFVAMGSLLVLMVYKYGQFYNKKYIINLEDVVLSTIFVVAISFDFLSETHISPLFIFIPFVVAIFALSFIGYRYIKKLE